MIKTVVIEDDKDLGALLCEFLISYHIECFVFCNAKDALEHLSANSHSYDLAIVDIGLPDMNGFELCKRIAVLYDIPIIVFSAKDAVKDKLYALDLGADDYVVKTVEPLELVARIKAVVRRSAKRFKKEAPETTMALRICDGVVYKNDERLNLSKTEHELLEIFMKSNGAVLSKFEIADLLCLPQNSRNIDMIIARLRHKIKDDPKNPSYIKNIWGEGYRFIC